MCQDKNKHKISSIANFCVIAEDLEWHSSK